MADEPVTTLRKRLASIVQLVVLLLLVVGLVWGWFLLRDPNNFPIKKVVIEADYQNIDQHDLQSIITPFTDKSFFAVSVSKLRDKILVLPWVSDAIVSRVWPNGLMIKVVEQVPVARWGEKSLINAEGKIFTPQPTTIPDDLPVLYGPDDQAHDIFIEFQHLNAILQPLSLSVMRYTLTPQRSRELMLSNNVYVILGNGDVLAQMQRFVAVYQKIIATREESVKRVDMRYTDGLAIEWKKSK